ncbi:MAG: tRNA (guanosine(46)-N7)-methyltransferase TrmB [Planctomycetes bacterium]|nr:tRNA (guanosine(46)-N7)-methyltransferase TrmB [Planctomycetota bacterium]
MKPRPELLDRYELAGSEQVGFPIDWSRVFCREAPLAVEIGYGGGEYLCWWAQRRADWDFVGIELPQDCVLRAVPQFSAAGLDNVRLLRGDARYLLRELFSTASLDRVLMQFPMPWPKEKHAKHRVYSPEFATTLADVLRPGGEFELVTDQEWYARETEAVLGAAGPFSVVISETGPIRNFHTRYERRWEKLGRETYRVVVRLEKPAIAPRRILHEEMKVMHLSQSPDEATMRSLPGRRGGSNGIVYEVKEVFYGEGGWFLYLVASDDSFSQHYYVRIGHKKDGRVLMRIHGHPRPYYTPAVRFSLEDLAAHLSVGVRSA